MRNLDDKETIRYLKRSYSAVDGLWFMKVEDSFDFDKALEIDNQVWKVVPKIQARFLKTLKRSNNALPKNCGSTISSLR